MLTREATKIDIETISELLTEYTTEQQMINRGKELLYSHQPPSNNFLNEKIKELEYSSILNRGAYVVDSLAVSIYLLNFSMFRFRNYGSEDYIRQVVTCMDLLVYSGRISPSELVTHKFNLINLSTYLKVNHITTLPESIKVPNFTQVQELNIDDRRIMEILLECGENLSKIRILATSFHNTINDNAKVREQIALSKVKERMVYEDITLLFLNVIDKLGNDFYSTHILDPDSLIELTAEIWSILVFMTRD
ncbi:MAG: hypothetical protein ABS904_00175 [Solibacillus isronensis]